MKKRLKILFNKEFKEAEFEKIRLQNWPRYRETEAVLLGRKIKIPDIASFQFMKHELFDQQIYKFNTDSKIPYIIDCGANIGLSIIYFKQLFPDAKIIGFEPDDKIFKILQHNIELFKLSNVELIKKSCWNKETILKFYSEGADGGRAAKNFDIENIIEVETVRLRRYLNKKVDFLKIDIEGAENEVLNDIYDLLTNVDKIFVEYHSFVGNEQMIPEILTILKDAGFRLHISSPGLISPTLFIAIKSYANMDNQLNIYGIR